MPSHENPVADPASEQAPHLRRLAFADVAVRLRERAHTFAAEASASSERALYYPEAFALMEARYERGRLGAARTWGQWCGELRAHFCAVREVAGSSS